MNELVETSGLNSSQVLATLFTLELNGIVRQLPGKRLNKLLLRTFELDHQPMTDASEDGREASRSRRSECRRIVKKDKDKVARRTHTALLALPEW